MGVAYNSNSIIPAPWVSFQKKYDTTEDGTIVGSTYSITIKGKIVAGMGSPDSTGAFWNTGGGTYPPDEAITDATRLSNIMRKQEALRKLFATEGKVLEWDPIYPDATTPIKCNPRIKGIEFAEGNWVSDCAYTIFAEADVLQGTLVGSGEDDFDDLSYVISKAQEDWSLEPADDTARTYRLTHTLSATGKRSYNAGGTLINGGAWQNAQIWVQARMGIDPNRLNPTGNILSLQDPAIPGGSTGYTANPEAFNYIRSEHVNELAGTYSVTETWLVFDAHGMPAPAVEEFNVNTRRDETGRTSVTLEGTIKGLEVRDGSSHELEATRFDNAYEYFAGIMGGLLGRAQDYSGITLNPFPLSVSSGVNPNGGTLTYHWEYNDRPVSIVTGSITENVTITIDNPGDVVAKQVVLGRAIGPLIQAIGTITEKHKTVSIEAQMPGAVYGGPALIMPDTDAIVASLAPIGTLVFWLERDTPTFNYTTGRYSRTTTWGYE